jgi:hypothetical protein
MISLMTESGTNLQNNCPACGAANEAGMLFCVNCGSQLGGDAPKGIKCPACGQVDEMSQTFCVYCGCSVAQLAAKEAARRPRRPYPAGRKDARTPAPSEPKAKAKEPNYLAAAILIGIAAGTALAFVAHQSGAFNLLARSNWPESGLVIYATPPEILVTIAERSGKTFTVGKTSRTGSLAIPDLPAGSYRVMLSSPGKLSVIKDIETDGKKAVVLGFPTRINLAAEQQ